MPGAFPSRNRVRETQDGLVTGHSARAVGPRRQSRLGALRPRSPRSIACLEARAEAYACRMTGGSSGDLIPAGEVSHADSAEPGKEPEPRHCVNPLRGSSDARRLPQPCATSKTAMLRDCSLNSTPTRWMDTPEPRYLSA